MRFAALLVAVVLASCGEAQQQAPGPRACGSTSEAEVLAAFTGWTQAYARRDLAGVMNIFSRDVQFEFEGQPKQGYADLESGFRREFAQPNAAETRWVGQPDRVMLTGDTANVISTWRLEANGQTRETNRAVDVLQRGDDCAWRIVRSVNYPVRE